MANSYSSGTVNDLLPKHWFTDDDLENLQAQGFSFQEQEFNGKPYLYFWFENGTYKPSDNDDIEVDSSQRQRSIPDWDKIFQQKLQQYGDDYEHLKAVVIEGANCCDKMRQGEFGGFAIIITKDSILQFNTFGWINAKLKELGLHA